MEYTRSPTTWLFFVCHIFEPLEQIHGSQHVYMHVCGVDPLDWGCGATAVLFRYGLLRQWCAARGPGAGQSCRHHGHLPSQSYAGMMVVCVCVCVCVCELLKEIIL